MVLCDILGGFGLGTIESNRGSRLVAPGLHPNVFELADTRYDHQGADESSVIFLLWEKITI